MEPIGDIKRSSGGSWQEPRADKKEYEESHFAQVRSSFSRDHTLSGEAKAIGLIYLDHADAKGEVYLKMEYLRKLTRFCEEVIERERAKLVEQGYLAKWPLRKKNGQFAGWRFKVTDKLRFRLNQENRRLRF